MTEEQMDINTTCMVSYICTGCGNGVRNFINIFSFSDNKEHTVKCPVCGNSAFQIKKTKGHSFNVNTECIYCGEIHNKNISASRFLNDSLGYVNCPFSNMGTFFYGSDKKLLADALAAVFKTIEDFTLQFEQALYETPDINKNSLSKEMLDTFKALNKERNISCLCGNTEIAICITFDGKIQLKCTGCGRIKEYEISSDNLLRLINTSFVVLGD